MDGGGTVNEEYGDSTWQARLLGALRGIEDNIVFRAWCLSRGREVKRRWWRHPAVTPLGLLVLSLLAFANLERINHLPGGFFLYSHDWVGILAVAWTVPLVYSAVLDALKMMGHGRISHWDEFVGQLKGTTVDDNEFLVAAFRICWPRLLLAAVGAVVALWLLAGVMAQFYPDDGGYSDMLMYGTPVAGLLVFNGALAGIAIVLLGLSLGRGARNAWVLVMGAGAWCAVLIITATLNLSYSLPLPNGERIYLVDFSTYYSFYQNQPRPLEILDPKGLFLVVIPLSFLILAVMALVLFIAARHRGLRAYLVAGWPLLLPLAGWLGYQGLAALGHALGNLGDVSPAGNVQAPLWFASLSGFNAGLFNPAGLELGWSGPVLRSARMQLPDLWFRHLVFTWTQLGFIGVLYCFALNAVNRWRRGED